MKKPQRLKQSLYVLHEAFESKRQKGVLQAPKSFRSWRIENTNLKENYSRFEWSFVTLSDRAGRIIRGGKNKKTKKQTEVSTQNWHSWVRGWKLLANVSPPWHRGADPGSRYGAWRCERGDDREAAMGAGEWRGCQVQWSAGSGGEGGCHILLTWPRQMRQSAGPRPGQVPQSLPRSRPQRLGPRLAPRSAQTRPDGWTAGRLDGRRLAGKVWSLQLMKRVSSVFTWDTRDAVDDFAKLQRKPHHTLQPRALKCSFSTIFADLFPEDNFYWLLFHLKCMHLSIILYSKHLLLPYS